MDLNKEMFLVYEAVRTSGLFNMFDPRARALANEMNDLNITREQWVMIMNEYNKMKETYGN